MRVIALDGPAGSGKSTVARALAERLGLGYLDTGAMYRAVAHAALVEGIDLADHDRVAELSRRVQIEVADTVLVDGQDATAAIRTPEVTLAVTAVAANAGVRTEMVGRQRRWVEHRGGGVVEGRDIGTVVFPEATVKVYLTADPEERARRRRQESGDALAVDIQRRDHADSSRQNSPLAVADGAVVIDTTGLEIHEVVDRICQMVEEAARGRD
jgi:CMP/dCMP kinase